MADPRQLKGSATEASNLFKADAQRRANATTILNPNEIRGEYNADRMLTTTLGGVSRVMTVEDMAVFRRNTQIAGKSFIGGITARQVIDRSTSVDRARARKEILWATPTMANKNSKGNLVVRFITDASGRNKAERHNVVIEFLGFQKSVISGAHTSIRSARIMSQENLKFDCDCGRHTYWLRYIATIGNFNAGRIESGYPKIRNPNLIGVACKHVLRVMAEIEGGVKVLKFLERSIENARRKGDKAKTYMKQEDANDYIDKQSGRSTRKLDSREERDLHRSRLALRKSVKVARRSIQKPKVIGSGSRKVEQLKKLGVDGKTSEAILLQTIKGLGLTKEQAVSLLSKVNK